MKALDANSALRSALQENLAARGIREVAAIERPDLSFLTTNKERHDSTT
jgi:molybdopterin biosynthesis enzyme